MALPTGTQIIAYVDRHMPSNALLLLQRRSIGASALCSAVFNCECRRYRAHFMLKWLSLLNQDGVHDPQRWLHYWNKMQLLALWCQGGQRASLCSPNLISSVKNGILPCFPSTPAFGLASCVWNPPVPGWSSGTERWISLLIFIRATAEERPGFDPAH